MESVVENPFGTQIAPKQSGALVEVESQRAIAETQAAMLIARKFPRDPIAVSDRILAACTRPTLAESALYSYARGGTEITGPSIRLAEVLAQEWGNVQFGIREMDQAYGESTVEAYCWDVEKNVRQVKAFKVKHVRNTKKGTYALEDSRDIYELVANNGARRLRACILGVIPGDVVEMAVKACEQTMTAKIPVTPERITAMLEMFSTYGITKEQIEKRIQRRVEALTPGFMVNLSKILNSLKDGMSTPSEWFETGASPEWETRTETLKEKLKKTAKPETDSPRIEEPIVPPPSGIISEVQYQALIDRLKEATADCSKEEKKEVMAKLMKDYEVLSIRDLPASRFEEAMTWINPKKEVPHE